MNSVPQFTLNDNLINNLSSQQYKLQRKPLNFNQYNIVTLLMIIFIISLVYFQIQIYSLKKTISSLSQVEPMANSIQNQLGNDSLGFTFPHGLLDLRASSIITTPNQIKFIYKLFGTFHDKFKLLYKATYFGDSFDSLENVLKDEDHILLIIKTEQGETIGAYTERSIQNKYTCLKLNSNFDSFSFNVNEEKKYSVYRNWDDFCQGILSLSHDIVLYDNFTSSDENYYDFSTKTSEYKDNETQTTHLKFRVKEMEIYKVTRI